MSKIRTTLIGYGNVGKELFKRILAEGWSVNHIIKSDGIWLADEAGPRTFVRKSEIPGWDLPRNLLDETAITFVTLPASCYGMIAQGYYAEMCKNKIPVVTCEKSSLVYLPHYITSLGCSAAVGGGTHLLSFLKKRVLGRHDVEAHLVVNGTLNFVTDYSGSLEEAFKCAGELRILEPNCKDDLLSKINNEIYDALLKTCIIARACFYTRASLSFPPKPDLYPKVFSNRLLAGPNMCRLEAEKEIRRFIVSFTRQPFEEDIIGGFRTVTYNGWHISAGFKLIDNPYYSRLIPIGTDNAALTVEGKNGEDCLYYLSGPGAGPKPTAMAMIQDAKEMLGIKNP